MSKISSRIDKTIIISSTTTRANSTVAWPRAEGRGYRGTKRRRWDAERIRLVHGPHLRVTVEQASYHSAGRGTGWAGENDNVKRHQRNRRRELVSHVHTIQKEGGNRARAIQLRVRIGWRKAFGHAELGALRLLGRRASVEHADGAGTDLHSSVGGGGRIDGAGQILISDVTDGGCGGHGTSWWQLDGGRGCPSHDGIGAAAAGRGRDVERHQEEEGEVDGVKNYRQQNRHNQHRLHQSLAGVVLHGHGPADFHQLAFSISGPPEWAEFGSIRPVPSWPESPSFSCSWSVSFSTKPN